MSLLDGIHDIMDQSTQRALFSNNTQEVRQKVLLFCSSMNIGGTETNVVNIARTIDRKKFDIKVYCLFSGGPLESQLKENAVSYTIGHFQRVYHFKVYWNILKMMRTSKVDVLHCFGYPTIYLGILLGRLAGVKKIIVSIQAWDAWKKWYHVILDCLLAPLVDLYIADGKGARVFAIKQQRLNPNKIMTIYDGVDFNSCKSVDSYRKLKKELGLSEDFPVVAVIARLDDKMKGISYFLESIPAILKEFPNTNFMIVGDGKDRGNLEYKANKLGIGKRLLFTGFRPDLNDIINITDILVIPSVQYESVPKILVHAMSWSKAIVATKIGDICELLEDQKTGILVAPQDSKEITNGVVRLLKNPDYARQLGKQARLRLFSQGLTLEGSVKNLENQYINLGLYERRSGFSKVYLIVVLILATCGFFIGSFVGYLKHKLRGVLSYETYNDK